MSISPFSDYSMVFFSAINIIVLMFEPVVNLTSSGDSFKKLSESKLGGLSDLADKGKTFCYHDSSDLRKTFLGFN